MTTENKKKFIVDLAFLLIVVAIIYVVFKFLLIYLFPFIIGLALTAIMQKPADFISKKTKLKKGTCALVLVVFSYAAIITALSFAVVGICQLITSIASRAPEIISAASGIFDNLKAIVGNLTAKLPEGFEINLSTMPSDLVASVVTTFAKWAPSFVTSVAAKFPSILVSVIVTFVASCYIAKDFETVKEFVKTHVKEKYYNLFVECKDLLKEKTFKIVKGYLILMCINFAEISVALLLFGVKNAVLIAGCIAVLDVLPILGTGTVLIPWSLISLINGNIGLGIGLLLLYIITVIVRNLIEPKIIGGQVGLHPLITLLCIFIGLRLFGFVGLLALPLAVIMLYSLYKDGKFDFLKTEK